MSHHGSASGALPTDLSKVTDVVLAAEREFGLLDRRVRGAPLWQRLRFEVHRRLLVHSGVMAPPEPRASTPYRWLGKKLRALGASLSSSAFDSPPRCDVLYVGGGRRVKDEPGGWYNPYCGPLARSCDATSLVVEFRSGRGGPAAPGVPTRYLDRLNAKALLAKGAGRSASIPTDVRSLLTRVSRRLHEGTGASLDLVAMARDDLTRREAGLPLVRNLFASSGARLVVLECSYDKHTFLEVARSEGLPTVEIQHGVVSRHHFGYHFPDPSELPPLFPDWFLAWGDFWRSAADFPVPSDRVLSVGFPRFDRGRTDVSVEPEEDRGEILFLSQAMLGEKLSRFAAALSEQGLKDKIVYRLHPREERAWKQRYPWLEAAGIRVTGANAPLYPQLRRSPIHVGVFSTALFEGLGLGGRTYLVKAPGIEYMDQVLETGGAKLVETPEELAESIGRSDESIARNQIAESFFRPGALRRACSALRSIMERGVA